MQRIFLILAAAVLAGTAWAQFTPGNTECIAPADPGGGWDFTCRIPGAQVMSALDLVPGSMQVTNMSGGGGGIAYSNVVTQRAGDENLIVAASTATATRLAQNVFAGFTADDVRWLGAVGADFGIVAVAADSEYQSINELLAAMQADPNSVIFSGGSAVGGWDHLKVLLLADAAGIETLDQVRYVSFDGGAGALLELIGGRANAFTGDTSEVLAQIEAGAVRVLAVMAPERVGALGDVPTAREAGFDVIGANWRAFYAPPGISDAAYEYWVDAVRQVARSEQWATLREQNGLAPFESFGADFESFVREQVAIIRTISEDLGLIQ